MAKFDPHAEWGRVVRLAEARNGVVTARELVRLGIAPSTIRHYAATGWLHRIHHGVYSLVPPALLSAHGRRHAAVLACGEGAALSHLHALAHYGLLGWTPSGPIDVSVSRRGGHSRPGIRIHRTATLRPEDVIEVHKVPTTTVTRAVIDSAGRLSIHQLESVLNAAVRKELLDPLELQEQLARARRRPDIRKLRRVLATWEQAAGITESDTEDRFLKLMAGSTAAHPETQAWLDLGDGGPPIRADFLYREAGLIVEADSRRWHDADADKRRDQRALAAGLTTLRIERAHLLAEPARIRATVERAYADGTAKAPALASVSAKSPT